MPIVAIAAQSEIGQSAFGIFDRYLAFLSEASLQYFIIPPGMSQEGLQTLMSLCDGLLFPGGDDVDPKHYGETINDHSRAIASQRDEHEFLLLRIALEANMPVLGICRGMQILNVGLGGSLYQSIAYQLPNAQNHWQHEQFTKCCQTIEVTEDGLLATIVGAGRHRVNSAHTQGIKDVAPGLRVEATSDDGIIECLSHSEKRFVLGVQWHPEALAQTQESRSLVLRFAAECARHHEVRLHQR